MTEPHRFLEFESQLHESNKTRNDDSISFGSPSKKPSATRTSVEKRKSEIGDSEALGSSAVEKASLRQPPGRLNITAATSTQSAPKTSSPVPQTASSQAPASIAATPSNLSSQSQTPTTASKAAEGSPRVLDLTAFAATQPRTLRVTTSQTTKPETVPASATAERSSNFPPLSAIRQQHSRHTSISDVSRISRPSSPGAYEIRSGDISRAGSPPAGGLTGSAPDKSKSKSQVRKERKSKGKTTDESRNTEDSTSAYIPPPVVEEIAPIISRQKKKKKAAQNGLSKDGSNGLHVSATSRDDAKSTMHVANSKHENNQNDEERKESKPSVIKKPGAEKAKTMTEKPPKPDFTKKGEEIRQTVHSLPAIPSEPVKFGPSMTVRELYSKAESLESKLVSEVLTDELTPARVQKLIGEMCSSQKLSLTEAFFAPPPLSAYRLPSDTSRQPSKTATPVPIIALTAADREAIKHNNEVRRHDPENPTDLSSRITISSQATIYRHLLEEEEERALDLEKRTTEHGVLGGALGSMGSSSRKLGSDDYCNADGNHADLINTPALFGIQFLNDDGPIPKPLHDYPPGAESEDEDEPLPLSGGAFGIPAHSGPTAMATQEAAERATQTLIDRGVPMEATRKAVEEMVKNAPWPLPQSAGSSASRLEGMLSKLKGLDPHRLDKKVKDTQEWLETCRKEVEKGEKQLREKGRHVGRWRESIVGLRD